MYNCYLINLPSGQFAGGILLGYIPQNSKNEKRLWAANVNLEKKDLEDMGHKLDFKIPGRSP
jgi:hypothetical protein